MTIVQQPNPSFEERNAISLSRALARVELDIEDIELEVDEEEEFLHYWNIEIAREDDVYNLDPEEATYRYEVWCQEYLNWANSI